MAWLAVLPLASLVVGGWLISRRWIGRGGGVALGDLGPGTAVIVGGFALTALIAVLMRMDARRRAGQGATYLLTVRSVESVELGLRLSPGIRPSETAGRPGIARMSQGSELELRRPDGTATRTLLATFGVSAWSGPDGSLYITDHPADPEIALFLPGDLSTSLVPPGTEVWLLPSADS